MQKRYETTLREAWKSGNGAEIISKIAKEKARNLEERAKYFEAKGIASRGWRGLTKGTMQRMQMMGYENSIPKVVIASTISGVVAAGAILTFFNNRHARHTLDELKIEVDALEEDRKSRVMAR